MGRDGNALLDQTRVQDAIAVMLNAARDVEGLTVSECAEAALSIAVACSKSATGANAEADEKYLASGEIKSEPV